MVNIIVHDIGQGPRTKHTSYSGHSKSHVFTQWQAALDRADYESCCHWAAEADCSHWQDVLWDKLQIYCSKNIHLQAPKLPLLLCTHIDTFDAFGSTDTRNNMSMRINLCQVIGIACRAKKTSVIALPKVDIDKVEHKQLALSTHRHIETSFLRDAMDCPTVVRILSSIVENMETPGE